MLKKIAVISFVSVVTCLVVVSCAKEVAVRPECTTTAAYAADIKPLVQRSCFTGNCHLTGFPAGDFTTYEGLKAKVDDGALHRMIDLNVMPPASAPGIIPLTFEERELFFCWIQEGAPNN